MKITKFEDIKAWQAARELMNFVYDSTSTTTFNADPRLRWQLRSAAGSVMANIAEGFDSGSDPEFRRFLRIAKRSATETQSHLYICQDRKYLSSQQCQLLRNKAQDVKSMILGFIRYLKAPRSPHDRVQT